MFVRAGLYVGSRLIGAVIGATLPLTLVTIVMLVGAWSDLKKFT